MSKNLFSVNKGQQKQAAPSARLSKVIMLQNQAVRRSNPPRESLQQISMRDFFCFGSKNMPKAYKFSFLTRCVFFSSLRSVVPLLQFPVNIYFTVTIFPNYTLNFFSNSNKGRQVKFLTNFSAHIVVQLPKITETINQVIIIKLNMVA